MSKARSSGHYVRKTELRAIKCEGASCDIYENKGTKKNGCQVPTVRHPGRAAGGQASVWTWAAGMSDAGSNGLNVRKAETRKPKNEGASGDVYENKGERKIVCATS
jgi:hypothetical protein